MIAMKVLLIDVDSKINLALMKISAFHKELGDEVSLVRGTSLPLDAFDGVDKAYVSCIFDWNARKALNLARSLPCSAVGGGYGLHNWTLPDYIEHMMPDYDLYGTDFSMGFTSRGCIRKCEFCNVWRNEGRLRDHAPVSEFWDPRHSKVILLDNNFIASPRWRENLDFCKDHGLEVSITQGIDARLVTKDVAKDLAKYWPFHDWKFNDKVLYTAWDRTEDEARVLRGIRNLIEAGIPARNIRPYVLVGFNTSLRDDLYRFEKLRELGVYPFTMSYNNQPHPMKRWGNRPALFKNMSFAEWVRLRKERGRTIPREDEVSELLTN